MQPRQSPYHSEMSHVSLNIAAWMSHTTGSKIPSHNRRCMGRCCVILITPNVYRMTAELASCENSAGGRCTPVFTALHGIQTRSSEENSVCLSVCMSSVCIATKQKNDLSRFSYHTKYHLA